jgi:hypothetical protein
MPVQAVGLHPRHFRVPAVTMRQLAMAAFLHDHTVMDNDNPAGNITYGRQAVRDNHGGTAGKPWTQIAQNPRLRFRIVLAGEFVEHYHFAVVPQRQERLRERYPRLLSFRKISAAVPDPS